MRFSLAKYIIVFIIIHSGIKFSLLCTKQVWCTGFLFRFSECFYRIKNGCQCLCAGTYFARFGTFGENEYGMIYTELP
jgi:hypothetical protein